MANEIYPSQDFPTEDPHRDPIRVPLINGDTVRYDVPPNGYATSKDNGPFEMTLHPVTINLIKALHGEVDREYTLSELGNLIGAKTGENIADRTTRIAIEELDIVNYALGVTILKARGSSPRLYSWASNAIFVAEAAGTKAATEVSTPEPACPPVEVSLRPTKNNQPIATPKPPSNPKPPKKPVPAPPRRSPAEPAQPKAEQKIHPHTKIEQQQTAFLDGLHSLNKTSGAGPAYWYLKKNQELAADDSNKQKAILLDAFNNIRTNLPYLLPGTRQSKVKDREKRKASFAQALRFIGENYENEAETLALRLGKTDLFTPDQLTIIGNRAVVDMVVEVSHEPLKRNPDIVLSRTFLSQAAIMLFHIATGPGLSIATHDKFTAMQRISTDLGIGMGHSERFIRPIEEHLDLPYRSIALMKELSDQLTIRNAVAKIDSSQPDVTEPITQAS